MLSNEERAALTALGMGKANADNQKMAINAIVTKMCGWYQRTPIDDTSYYAGQRNIALSIIEATACTPTLPQREELSIASESKRHRNRTK